MNAPSSVAALTTALVHQSAVSQPAVRHRHAAFIAKRLGLSFAVLAVAPFFLAFRGAPSGAETLVFACGFAPLSAAVVAARTGRLSLAHAVAGLGLVGMALTSWFGLGCGAGGAIAWLVAAQIETALAGEGRLTGAAAAFNSTVLLAILATRAGATGTPLDAACATLAFAYAALVSADAWAVRGTGDGESVIDVDAIAAWETAADLLDDVVVRFDAAGTAVRIPRRCETRFGVAAGDLAGRGFFEHVHVGDRPAFLKAIADAAHADAPTTARLRLRTSGAAGTDNVPAPPTHLWIEMRARRMADATAVVAVLRDVDAAESQAMKTAAAQRSVEEAIRAKDHFLANMSHELRTPLNAIIGFSEMLSSRTLCPADAGKQREYAKIIHQSGQHLLAVVNSILDMSKIRSGTFEILSEPFAIAPLVDECCDMVKLKADKGLVQLGRDCPKDLAEIVGDKRACKQILINLLSNAVKFTPEHGEVVVAVRPDGNALLISVTDSGVGINAADLARLGDPFFQARSSRNRPFEGTGLGLSVVRGLVGLHGGTIALESEPGRGTRVSVRLPLDHRIQGPVSQSATIETISRRRPVEPAPRLTDRRIKQSA